MKSFKRAIVLAIALAVTVPWVVTAGGGQEGGTTGSEEPVPITFLTSGDSGAPWIAGAQDDRIFQEINSILNIELKVEAYRQGQWEKVNVAIASGDMPDLVVNNFPSAAAYQWIRDGVLAPLNDYFDYMPAVKQRCEDESWSAFDGKYYGFLHIAQKVVSNYCMAMRGDWLEAVGMEWPETLDDFWDVSEAFVKNDPDGNGKDDTYAFTARKPGNAAFRFLFAAYGMPHLDYNLGEDGKVIAWFEHPAWMEGMKYIMAMWEAGFIDPEFMLNDRQMLENKFYNDTFGIGYFYLFRHVNRNRVNLQKVNPDGTLVMGDPPAGPEGKRGGTGRAKGGLYTGITSGAKNPIKAAQFLQFIVDEGRDLLTLGIEGIHYTGSGDNIKYIEEERAKDNFSPGGWAHPLAWGNVWWPLSAMYLPLTEPNRDDALLSVEYAARNLLDNLIDFTPDAQVELGAQVGDFYNEYFLNIVMGRIGLDAGYKELVEKWYSNGGTEIIAEAQKLYDESKN